MLVQLILLLRLVEAVVTTATCSFPPSQFLAGTGNLLDSAKQQVHSGESKRICCLQMGKLTEYKDVCGARLCPEAHPHQTWREGGGVQITGTYAAVLVICAILFCLITQPIGVHNSR